MKLKGYIKLLIMALTIMFLTTGIALSVESSNCAITGGHTIVASYGSGTMTDYYNAISSSGGSTGSSPLGFDKATAGGVGYYRVYNAFDDGGWYPINKSIDFSIDGCYNFYLNAIGHTTSTDYNQYEKGETAHIDINFNSSTFNTVNYSYYFYLIDPDNIYKFFDEEINAPVFSVDTVLNKVGVYRIQVRITNKTDVLTSLYTNEISVISTDGTSISFIDFDKSSYKLGETAVISWGISSDFWSNFGIRYFEIWKDGVKIDESDTLPFFGTRQYKFPAIGQYEAQLWEYSLLSGHTKRSTSLLSWVEYNPSYIIMNNSIPIKTNIFVNYTLGETDGTTDLINVIEAHYLNSFDNSYTLESSCYFNNVNDSGSCIMNVDKVGTYLFTLENLRLNLLMDSELISSYYVDNKPKNNYTTSSINVTKDQWYQGDYISGNYQVKASQFNSSEIYLNYYSVTDNYHYSFSYTLLEDTGTFNNFIPEMRTGHNIVYLNYTNSTQSGNLAQKSFNVSTVTSTGYGLTLSSYEVELDEIFNIYVTIPPYPSKGKLRVVEQTYNEEVYNITLNNSITIPQSSGISGTYSFILSDSSDEVQVMRLLIVKPKSENTTTITQTNAGSSYGLGDDKTSTGMVTNLIILLGMPIFWGLVFIVAAIFKLKNSKELILPVIFIIIHIEAVVGMLEPYGTYIVIVTWLIIAINFLFVQKKMSG